MKTVIITEDVRIGGISYKPGRKKIDLDDDVADEMLKFGFAKVPSEKTGDDKIDSGGSDSGNSGNDQSGSGNDSENDKNE